MKTINGHKTTIVAILILAWQLFGILKPDIITPEINLWFDGVSSFLLLGTLSHKGVKVITKGKPTENDIS